MAGRLRAAGHDVAHVGDYDMQAATDAEVLDRAERAELVVISAETRLWDVLAAC